MMSTPAGRKRSGPRQIHAEGPVRPVTIALTQQQHELLLLEADKRGVSLSGLVRQIIAASLPGEVANP